MNKRELIIKSAKNLILEKGYTNVSVEDITKNAGMAKGSFYTYFKSKHCVLDYILLEKLHKIKEKIKNFYNGVLSLEEAVEKMIKTRIILEDDDSIKKDLIVVNLFRNIDSLEEETLSILMELEVLNQDFIKEMLKKYPEKIKIKDNEVEFYSKLLNDIISTYKNFDLFICENKKEFITTTEELKKKYKNRDFKRNLEIIKNSILKILIY